MGDAKTDFEKRRRKRRKITEKNYKHREGVPEKERVGR